MVEREEIAEGDDRELLPKSVSYVYGSMRRKKETNLSLPGGAVKVRVLELGLDLLEQVTAQGAIRDVVVGEATTVLTGIELTNNAALSVPNEGTRVTLRLDGEVFAGLVYIHTSVRFVLTE